MLVCGDCEKVVWIMPRRLLVLFVFLEIFLFGVSRETDIDFWWHLRTGEMIAQTGAVPRVDPFSFTAAGRPWVVHEWLWELLAYALYSRGGYRLLALLSATVVTVTYGIVYRLLRRLGANELVSAVLTLWAAALALPDMGVRPREWTQLFFAVYLSQLLLYRVGCVRSLWMLPLIMVIWVNLHGAFVLGLALFGIVAIGETWQGVRGGGGVPRQLWATFAATAAATAVNPRGPLMLLYPFGYYFHGDNPSFQLVSEFQSPNFHDPLVALFLGGIVLLMLVGTWTQGRVIDAMLATVFLVLALMSARQVSVWALVCAPLLAQRLSTRFAWARSVRQVPVSTRRRVLDGAILGVLLIAAMGFVSRPPMSDKLQAGPEPRAAALPVAGAQFVVDHDLPGPVFNDQAWGGYLIYRWYPSRRVFIDGRIDMYGPDIVRDYVTVAAAKPGWRDVLERYAVRTVLVGHDSALSVLLGTDPQWRRVFQGEVEDLFVQAVATPQG